MREQALSITGRTTGILRPSGYGVFAHQHDQNWLTRTPSFYDLNDEKGQSALTFLFKKEKRAKKPFAIMKPKSFPFVTSFSAWLIYLTKFLRGMFSSFISTGKSCLSR